MKFSKYLLLLLMVISLSSCAHARTSMVGADGQSPVVKVVRDVREAVVQIKVEAQVSTRQNTNPFFNDDPFFRFFFPVPNVNVRLHQWAADSSLSIMKEPEKHLS